MEHTNTEAARFEKRHLEEKQRRFEGAKAYEKWREGHRDEIEEERRYTAWLKDKIKAEEGPTLHDGCVALVFFLGLGLLSYVGVRAGIQF